MRVFLCAKIKGKTFDNENGNEKRNTINKLRNLSFFESILAFLIVYICMMQVQQPMFVYMQCLPVVIQHCVICKIHS